MKEDEQQAYTPMCYKNIKEQLVELGILVLRLTLAVAMFPHGAQKVLGWFGGYGYSATYSAFTQQMGIPGTLAVLAIVTEFAAPILLVLGLLNRVAALALVILMSVAMSFHVQNGFFMNWFGQQQGEGIEYHILVIGAALALAITGAGRYSIDALCAKNVHKRCACHMEDSEES